MALSQWSIQYYHKRSQSNWHSPLLNLCDESSLSGLSAINTGPVPADMLVLLDRL